MGNVHSESFGKIRERVFDIGDTFTFGKYKGNTVEDVLHDDYKYIEWCLDNLPWFKVSEEVYEKLTSAIDSYYESRKDYEWYPDDNV